MINIKKYLKMFIITCFLFVCFITTAYAGQTVTVLREKNLNCDDAAKNLEYFNYKKTDKEYTFTLKSNVKESVKETITCTYDGAETGDGFAYKPKITLYGTPAEASSGKMIYSATFTATVSETFDFLSRFQLKSIIDFNVQEGGSAAKIVGCKKGTNQCYLSLVETNDGKNTHTLKATFKYSSDGVKYEDAELNMTLKYIGNIAAHPGDSGTCTMDSSQWDDGHLGGTWTNLGGQTVGASFYLSKKNTNVTFGNCKPKDPNLVKFVGWVPSEYMKEFNAGVGQLVGQCTTFPGLVKGGQTVASPSPYYSACYEYVPSVKLKGLRGGKLSDTWDTYGVDSYIKKAGSASDKVKLPSVSYTDFNKANGTGYEFAGWSDGSDIYPAGASVPADGTVYTPILQVSSTQVNYFKIVYLKETFNLKVSNANACSLGSGADKFVSASFESGTCKVTGKALTDENEFATITVTKTDGTTVSYKFRVLNPNGETGYEFDENNIPIIEPGSIAGRTDTYTVAHGDGTGEMIADNKCNQYIVKSGGESDQWNTDSKNVMRSGVFKVSCSDGSSLGDLIALCLDPGIMGPTDDDEIKYVKSFDVKAGSDFAKLLNFLSKRMKVTIDTDNEYLRTANMSDKNNARRIAYHIAVRIVGLKYFDNGHNAMLRDHYVVYKAASDALPKKGKINNANEIVAPLNIRGGEWGNAIKTELKYVLSHYREDDDATSDTNEQFSNVVSSIYKDVKNADAYTLTYKGKFTLPAGATNINVTTDGTKCLDNSTRGYTCKLVSHKVLDEKDQYGRIQVEYEVLINVPVAKNVKPPKSSEAKVEKSIKVTYTGKTAAQVSILQPTQSDGANYQRMVSVDPTPNKIFVYLPPGTGRADNMCKNTKSLDISNCTDAEHCSGFNKRLFVDSGCCAFVEDDDSYVAKGLCKGTCVESTMQSTCQFQPFGSDKKVDVYEIKEGAVLSGNTLNNHIGVCIVNVAPLNGVNIDDDSFEKEDSAGNSIMVSEYNGNRYCRVSCKEDFTITLGAFGNYVGASTNGRKGAVAAGKFFNLDDDIYMGGKRSCYTTFIDYNKYLNDIAQQSAKIANGFSTAFINGMRYTDLDENQTESVVETTKTFCVSELATCTCDSCNDSGEYSYACDKDGNDANGKEATCWATYHCPYTTVTEEDGAHNNPTVGQSYCPSGASTYKAYYYAIKTPSKSKTYGSTTWSADTYSGQYSGTYNKNVDTAARPSKGTDAYQKTNPDVYSCEGVDGHGKSQPSSCKQRGAQTVYNEKGANIAEGYKGTAAGGRSDMSSAYANMKKYAEQFYDCQHFQLNPTEIGDKANNAIQTGVYWGNPGLGEDGKFHGSTRGYIQIDSKFDPTATYTYDEKTMMDIVGKDNEVEEYTEKNNQYMSNYNTQTNKKVTYKNGLSLYRNYISYGFYQGTGSKKNVPWESDSSEALNYKSSNGFTIEGTDIENLKNSNKAVESAKTTKNYDFSCDAGDEKAGAYCKKQIVLCSISSTATSSSSVATVEGKEGASMTVSVGGGGVDYHWKGGACYSSYVYYTKANYVTTSISNSSIYKNKGAWVQSEVNGSYEHGLSGSGKALIKSALEKAKTYRKVNYDIDKELSKPGSGNGVYGSWSVLSVKDNVFPISFITPRNLYTYTYTFSNIGMYGDGSQRGRLGRILGDDNSVIKENQRTCFYEVYESTCICCGAERIDTYNAIYKNKEEVLAEVEKSESVVKEFVDKNKSLKSKVSDKNAMKVDDTGAIAFGTSTVSPSDLNGDTNRNLASNFGTYTFDYDNALYITEQGQYAKTAIETQGENIYNETPEYIYKLTPTAIKQIQDYNKSHPYGIDEQSLRRYDQVSIVPINACTNSSACQWTVSSANSTDERADYASSYVTFTHLGSGFLEDIAEGFVPDGYTTLASSKNICTITAEDAKDPSKVRALVDNNKCRWVDYIETANAKAGKKVWTYSNVSNPSNPTPKTQQIDAYFRLSFK